MISRNGLLPLYQQVRADLEQRVRKGTWTTGERIPSEHQLCEEYGVSRITVRQALDTLVQQGVLQRAVGRGTFVAGQPYQRLAIGLALFGFEEEVYRRQPEIFGQLISGVTRGLENQTVSLQLLHFPTDAEPAEVLREALRLDRFHGLLIRSYHDLSPTQAAALDALGVPYVLIKRSIPGVAVRCVVSDDVAGARLAVRHLLQLGHRRIGLVLAPRKISIWRQRYDGYVQALHEAGLPIDDDLVVECEDSMEEDGQRGAARLLDGAKSPPSAIFVASDLMAVGVYRALHECGRVVPDEISVIGYDGFQFGEHLRPPLTTIRTAYFAFGTQAVRLLARAISGGAREPERVEVPPELLVRGSTGPAPITDSRSRPTPGEPVRVS